MSNNREWSFVADMNYDGYITYSDIWCWIKWFYFYIGDWIFARIMEDSEKITTFFELTTDDYGGFLSGIISLFYWNLIIGAFIEVINDGDKKGLLITLVIGIITIYNMVK